MAIRTALLNGNNISRDTDFSKYIETVSEAGVIEGLEVSATKVGIGKARVPCERTGGETIYALVYNSSEVSISGNGDVYIQVSQTYIDDGELANEDGTGIATIQVGTMPSKNALKLATITSGTPTDARNMIPKVGELNTQIESIFDSLEDLDERVEALEEAGAIDHLEESGLVGELYTLSDTLFKQNTPTLADSTLDCNVSDTSANTQIHIQRIGSGVASNQLKLKVKMVGSSTQNLKVEVRKGVQVTVTEGVEAYWYGNQVIASGSIAYSDISSDYAEKTITLDNNFGGTKGELLDIVVYMDTVNASNYYCVACDSTQYSEGFGYVSVNGSTRTRSKLMPYGISEGFAQSMLVKVKEDSYFGNIIYEGNINGSAVRGQTTTFLSNIPCSFSNINVSGVLDYQYNDMMLFLMINGTQVDNTEEGMSKGYFNYSTTISTNTITCAFYDASSGGTFSIENFKIQAGNNEIQGTPNTTVRGYADRLKELGDLGTIIIFGLKPNREREFGPSDHEFSSTATVGSITPGNYTGYLTIKGADGKVYKVGVYGV